MNPREIEVDQCEMKKANYPNTLRSGGLGPCIAIGIYDPKTKSGYMIHEPSFEYTDLDKLIKKIQKDYGDLSELKVFAVGNSIDSNDDAEQKKYDKKNRNYVEQILKKYFQDSQLKIKWMPEDYCSELILHTSNGEFELYSQSLDEIIKEYEMINQHKQFRIMNIK